MTRWAIRAGLLSLIGVGLAACGGGGDNNNAAVTTPAPQPVAKLEDSFGANFGADFRSQAGEPNAVAAADLTPVSLTTEPTTLH